MLLYSKEMNKNSIWECMCMSVCMCTYVRFVGRDGEERREDKEKKKGRRKKKFVLKSPWKL